MVRGSHRLTQLSAYAFAAIQDKVAALKAEGRQPVDFGVGDPTLPTPALIRRECAEGIERHASSGYPPYKGTIEFRQAVSDWTERRFGVSLDPNTEASPSDSVSNPNKSANAASCNLEIRLPDNDGAS